MFVEGDRDSMQLLETELWIPDGGTIQYGSEFLLVLLMSEIAIGPVSMSVDTCVFAISKKSSMQLWFFYLFSNNPAENLLGNFPFPSLAINKVLGFVRRQVLSLESLPVSVSRN